MNLFSYRCEREEPRMLRSLCFKEPIVLLNLIRGTKNLFYKFFANKINGKFQIIMITLGVKFGYITCLFGSFNQICRSYLENWLNGFNEEISWHEFTVGWFWLRGYVSGFMMDGSGYILALLACVKSKYFHQIKIKQLLVVFFVWLEYAWVQKFCRVNLWVLFGLPNFVFVEIIYKLFMNVKAFIGADLFSSLLKLTKFCRGEG